MIKTYLDNLGRLRFGFLLLVSLFTILPLIPDVIIIVRELANGSFEFSRTLSVCTGIGMIIGFYHLFVQRKGGLKILFYSLGFGCLLSLFNGSIGAIIPLIVIGVRPQNSVVKSNRKNK